MRRRVAHRRDEETTYWLSYSDMMAGLLLCFVLIISLTVLRSKVMYDEKQNELAGKEQELIIQSEELENERLTIEEQGAKLNAQELKLSEQEGELLAQQRKLEEQSQLLKELEKLMGEQQAKLDNIIGIRSELVEALRNEFDNSSLSISVDEKTGAITMDSNILYEYNKSTLKSGGKDFLGEFMPRYLKILLSPKYSKYISEIVKDSKFLTDREKEEFEKVLSTVGKSFSEPILNPDGSVNADASRRVEILFRLRDEEMIREMMEILNETSTDRLD